MTLSVRSLASRAVSLPFSVGATAISSGVGLARRLPHRLPGLPIGAVTSTVARIGGAARDEVGSLGARGLGTLARLRGAEEEPEADLTSVLDPFELPEPVAEIVEEAAPGATLRHDALPLEDYDHLTIGSLRARIRGLEAPELIQLRDYERAHGNRLPVLTAFDNRLKSLAADTPGAGQATLVTL